MNLCSADLVTRVLTWGTLSAALSSALWLSAAGDDNYPMRNWLEDLFSVQTSGVIGSTAAQSAAERARTARRALPERRPALR